MKQMFESATLKLTAWYLLILMVISLLFSVIIYQISTSEVNTRLGIFESRLENGPYTADQFMPNFQAFRTRQLHESEVNLFLGLMYANLVILLIGGAGSYFLARRTLKPIEASHEAQARFTSDASHELRTPLAVMKSELEVALRDPNLSKGDMRQLLESNLEEVNRLSDLSSTLLKFSKNDLSDIKMESLNLRNLTLKAIKAHGDEAKRITSDIPKDMTLHGNESSITELIMILLDNALRYSPPGSEVVVTGDKARRNLIISNQGVGISKEDLPHVFERFYRGDKSRSTASQSGYGLGLSLAKNITDLHGAHIEIISTPDKITSVSIDFKA